VTDLVAEPIAVGDLQLTLLRPADPEALVDEEAFAADEFLPYWAELWPSSVALAHLLSGLDVAGARVLELGCGLGLPSLVAALRGADVVASDWSADAIELLARNADANGATRLRAVVAAWSDPAALGREEFDLVLAADVLYEERNVPALLRALGRLARLDGTALVVDPGRRHATGFVPAARAAGWRVRTGAAPGLRRGTVYRLTREEG
jgi:predicted nicotinamide N-methyase